MSGNNTICSCLENSKPSDVLCSECLNFVNNIHVPQISFPYVRQKNIARIMMEEREAKEAEEAREALRNNK
jgi:hypothetical protein